MKNRHYAVGLPVLVLLGIVGLTLMALDALEEEGANKRLAFAPMPNLRQALMQPLRRWRQDLEDAAVDSQPLFTPAPLPGRAQQERGRCEIGWRCYATDPDAILSPPSGRQDTVAEM
jgi:hypothetical protein